MSLLNEVLRHGSLCYANRVGSGRVGCLRRRISIVLLLIGTIASPKLDLLFKQNVRLGWVGLGWVGLG